jgi:hypothetical protein
MVSLRDITMGVISKSWQFAQSGWQSEHKGGYPECPGVPEWQERILIGLWVWAGVLGLLKSCKDAVQQWRSLGNDDVPGVRLGREINAIWQAARQDKKRREAGCCGIRRPRGKEGVARGKMGPVWRDLT